MPWGLVTIGWRPSLWALAAVCLAYGLVLLAARRPLEPTGREAAAGAPAGQ